jgi:alpha-glucosidase (family GH31 glycosyl hydrolase)
VKPSGTFRLQARRARSDAPYHIRLAIKPLLALAFALLTIPTRGEDLQWGIDALAMKSPWTNSPSLVDLLSDWDHTVVMPNYFYRSGGDNHPATPTEWRLSYNSEKLFAVFRCKESDLAFPSMHHDKNWLGLVGTPPDQDSAFPDKVDFFVQPDMNRADFYQFAVTMDDMKFGCLLTNTAEQTEDNGAGTLHILAINDFEARVVTQTNDWIAVLAIPWKTIGGVPQSYFGLLPVRTRWRDGEVSSPVAFDFSDRPPPDLFIETSLNTNTLVWADSRALYELPSGTLRWRRPALLVYPDPDTKRQIWQMQQSLGQATDTNNLAQRIFLTQRWMDLLTLEGFNFRATSGSIADGDMTPARLRRQVNAALQRNKTAEACRLIDAYLRKLDKVSRDWFADGSPGDISGDEWKSVSEIDGVETVSNELVMHGRADGHPVDLYLSLPKTGGIRLHARDEGFFRPDGLSDLNMSESSNSCSFPAAGGKIVVDYNPFAISILDADGKAKIRLDSGAIAFRFDTGGKVVAENFQNRLDPAEVIYGFGEKYDRFNQNGNVLTLWGMDDWTGNTVGLMNQSYKPVPVFHSSRGYTIFDNSTYRLRCDIGKTVPDQYRLTQPGPIFDYYFWIAPPEKAIESYTALTGKPVLPPKWAFELWMGRTGRGWTKPTHDPVAEEERVVKQFTDLDIPHSAIYSEGAGADSEALNQFMSAHGLKVLSWFFPVIGEGTQENLMPEVKTNDLPVLRTRDPWQHVDFSNPNALELARRWWKHRLDIGVAGSMVDFGDRVTEDAVFYDGKRGDEMHNFYSYDYHRTYSEVFREKRGDDFILFGRAAAPGTQKFVAQFGGDHAANFTGLQGVLNGALNLCACGFSTWGSDLGGFLGWPEPAVYMRWTQFACFSPLMRCHGRTPREPWNYGDDAVANYKYYAWVRENLLDYIYNAAITAHETGIPIMRSMPVAFPEEPELANVTDQYLFGPDLLVAPVVSDDDAKTIALPFGRWTDLWNGKTLTGPASFTTTVPANQIPVFMRAGTIFPARLNSDLQFGHSFTSNQVNVLVLVRPEKTTSWTNAQNRSDSAQIEPHLDHFDISISNASGFNDLLIYGAPAVTAVNLNGNDLPADDWRLDHAANRLSIHLPPNQSQGKIEVRFEPNF